MSQSILHYHKRNVARAGRCFLYIFLFCFCHTQLCSAANIKIAAIYAQTGLAASHNKPLVVMTRLAVDQINLKGGVLGKKLELILIDNQSTPIGSAIAAKRAVELQVTAVIGGHWSSHSIAMAPILQAAQIPMISPASTNPEVTRKGDYIFRVCFVDSLQGKAMAQFAREKLNAKKAVVLVNIDESYSVTLARFFRAAFTEAAGEIQEVIRYRGDDTDFTELLLSVKQYNPDVVYLPGYTRDSGLIIKQAHKMNISPVFLGGDAWDEIVEISGTAIDGSYQTAAWHPSVPNDQSDFIRKLYFTRFGKELLNYSSPLAYDAVMVLRAAIELAKSTDGVLLKRALLDLHKFEGATGSITFDQNGDPADKDIMIIQFQEDRPVFVQAFRP